MQSQKIFHCRLPDMTVGIANIKTVQKKIFEFMVQKFGALRLPEPRCDANECI